MKEAQLNLLKIAGFSKEVDRINKGECPFCGEKIIAGDFKDALSFKEFTLSGLCQNCQNKAFKNSRHIQGLDYGERPSH